MKDPTRRHSCPVPQALPPSRRFLGVSALHTQLIAGAVCAILATGCDAILGGSGAGGSDSANGGPGGNGDPNGQNGDGDSGPDCVDCPSCEEETASSARIRRLSETEYDNALEALLGISTRDSDLAADTQSGPIATNRGTPVSTPGAQN